jgi:5-methyltetrahydropteroyltriglutamate--homocysteine methyltransferase
MRYADLVGRENVIAAPDCGFATFAFRAPRVHPEIMWAKFAALVEGARQASQSLWSY